MTSAGAFSCNRSTSRSLSWYLSLCTVSPCLPILKPPTGQVAEEFFNEIVVEFV